MALPQREECVLRDVPQPVLPPAAEAGEEEGELALAGGAAELERRGQDDVRERLVLHLLDVGAAEEFDRPHRRAEAEQRDAERDRELRVVRRCRVPCLQRRSGERC